MNITEIEKLKDGDIVAVQCGDTVHYGILLARYSPSIYSAQIYFKDITQHILIEFCLSSAAIYGNNIFDVPIECILRKEQSNPFEQYVHNRQFKQLCGKLVYVPILQKTGQIISIDFYSNQDEDMLSYINRYRSGPFMPIAISRQETKYYIHVDSSSQIEPYDFRPEDFILLEVPLSINISLVPQTNTETNLLHAIFQSIKNKKRQS